jgi:hypothetical protein
VLSRGGAGQRDLGSFAKRLVTGRAAGQEVLGFRRAPQAPWSHHFLVPVRPSSSRSASSSVTRESIDTSCVVLLTRNDVLIVDMRASLSGSMRVHSALVHQTLVLVRVIAADRYHRSNRFASARPV